MPRRVFASVCGEDYTSKTALQAEWRKRVKRYPHPTTALGHKKVGKDAGRATLKPVDVEWFVSAAAAVPGHNKYLFGGVQAGKLALAGEANAAARAAELAKALEHTAAYIDSIPSGIKTSRRARSRKSKGPDHRCVYFMSLTDPSAKSRAVPLTLGETEAVKQKKFCTRWLREAVSAQIRLFINRRKYAATLRCTKNYKPYTCNLCGRSCASKSNHVDHGTGEHSFKELVRRFDKDILKRAATAADGSNEQVVHKWQQFHKKHAKLTLTCAKCNLKNK